MGIKRKSCLLLAVLMVLAGLFNETNVKTVYGEESSDINTFNFIKYKADINTNKDEVPYRNLHLKLDNDTPSRKMVIDLENDVDYQIEVAAWETLTFDPANITEKSLSEIEYYETIILSLLKIKSESPTYIKYLTGKNTTDVLSVSNSITTFLKKTYQIDYEMISSKENLSDVEEKQIAEGLKKWMEINHPDLVKSSDVLSTYSFYLKQFKTAKKSIENYVSYLNCISISNENIEIITDMYERSSDPTMQAAILKVKTACEGIPNATFVSTMDISAKGFESVYKIAVGDMWKEILGSSSLGKGVLIGQNVGKAVSDMFFSTDKSIEQYYKMKSLKLFENVLRESVKGYEKKYIDNPTEENALLYFAASDMLYQEYDLSCDFAKEYADIIFTDNISSVIAKVFTGENEDYNSFLKSIERIREYNDDARDDFNDGYLICLMEDYPILYEKLKEEDEKDLTFYKCTLGGYNGAVLNVEGKLFCWGSNKNGTVGNGKTDNQLIPEVVLENVKTVAIAPGHGVSVAVSNDDYLYCWGYNKYGQVGNGTFDNQISPMSILGNVKNVYIGGLHTAALTRSGKLYCWGNNTHGQIGDDTTDDISKPKKIMNNIKDVSLGLYHSAAIDFNGDLYCWGNNIYGQVGNGTTENQLKPVKIMEKVKKVVLGSNISAAITEDGSLYCWGNNYNGRVGNGNELNQLVPYKVLDNVEDVILGLNHSAAIDVNGNLFCWGDNYKGQLGNGKKGIYGKVNKPVKILEDVKMVALGGYHSAAVTNDNTLYCWGDNQDGELGDGTTSSKELPTKILDGVDTVCTENCYLGDGYRNTMAFTLNGELYCWGNNYYGQVGNGDTVDQSVPVKILENVNYITKNNGSIKDEQTSNDKTKDEQNNNNQLKINEQQNKNEIEKNIDSSDDKIIYDNQTILNVKSKKTYKKSKKVTIKDKDGLKSIKLNGKKIKVKKGKVSFSFKLSKYKKYLKRKKKWNKLVITDVKGNSKIIKFKTKW